MDIKKILVPIDGSDASERAFSYAVAFAKKTAAELILLYVVDADVLMYPVYRVSLAETDTASVKKKGEDILALYAQDAPEDVKVNRMVTIGVPGSSIIARLRRREWTSLSWATAARVPFLLSSWAV